MQKYTSTDSSPQRGKKLAGNAALVTFAPLLCVRASYRHTRVGFLIATALHRLCYITCLLQRNSVSTWENCLVALVFFSSSFYELNLQFVRHFHRESVSLLDWACFKTLHHGSFPIPVWTSHTHSSFRGMSQAKLT